MFRPVKSAVPSAHAAQIALDLALRRPGRRLDPGRTSTRNEDLAPCDGRGASDSEVSRGDRIVERGADRLQELAERAAAQGGAAAKLAETLAEDAAFLRKLKPSLIKARARGEAPTDAESGTVTIAPSGPQLSERRHPPRSGGPNPFVVVGAALALGVLLAKVIDWRSHAHPRD